HHHAGCLAIISRPTVLQTHKIWVNLDLVRKSPACLEYLVVHEMAHLIEPSHNHRFKAVMDTHLPNWRIIKKHLNTS
ncbi:MAG: YgjP-like metallopeptidase domain-containing protein, partial [Pseudomonadota bacterium]